MSWPGIMTLFAVFASLFVACGFARADEVDVPVKQFGESCTITSELRVRGPDTTPCVEYLETAVRLAKAERLVNKRRRR